MNRRGIDLAVREINGTGGVLGRPLEVIAVDDSSMGSRALTIATDFLNDPRIVGVVGHIESGPMEAAARVYDAGLPAIATTATSPTLTGLSPWVFRVVSSDSVNGRDLAVFARSQGFVRAAILYENTAYGRGLAEAIARHFGGAIVARDPIATDSTSNVEPNVAYLRTRQPDIVFVAGTAASGLHVLREARRQGLRAVFAGGDGWSGVATDHELAEGVMVAVPFTATDPRPEVVTFVQAFRAAYGADPDGNAALAYDATRLLARAIAQAGPSRLAVRDYLRDHLPGEPFAGVTGSIQFAASGDVVGKPFVVTRVRSGALLVATGGAN